MRSVIVAAKRTPIGSFSGSLSTVPAPKLAATVIQDLVKQTGVSANEIESVVLGNVLQAGVGQSPARQALIFGGLPKKVSALTVNKVCGSGLKAVMLADQAIRCGDQTLAIAGGMENMSLAPYALPKARTGYRMGPGTLEDLMIKDGLWDPYSNQHMGAIGEVCAREYSISREQQDEYALQSYQRALAAQNSGRFQDEIVPVEVSDKRGNLNVVDNDEEPKKAKLEKLKELKTVFDKNGSITAGNASSLNDGAAGVMLVEESRAKELGLKPLVRIVASAESSQDPGWFTTAPASAMRAVLNKAGLEASDIDLWEVNEAFAVVSLYNNKELGITAEKCNVNGGAVALGHPIGASGARILVTLIHELLKREDARYGLASLCIGGGEAVAMIVEKV